LTGFGFTTPIVGIWVKQKVRIVRERKVKGESKKDDHSHSCPLKPSCASSSRVVRRKGHEDEKDEQERLNALAVIEHRHLGSCFGVFCVERERMSNGGCSRTGSAIYISIFMNLV